jgi:hypothetical protein
LYLAQHTIKGKRHYFIKESYKDGNLFRSRQLFVLGTNPGRYVVYPGGRAFYIDGVVEDRLASFGVEPSADEIEDLFWPFIKPEIRRAIEPLRQRGRARRKSPRPHPKEQAHIRAQATEFDKRRIHYLRSGRMDQAGLGRMPLTLYLWLLAKSRDEIEQRFIRMERRLDPSELKTYAFVIFDLQRFFTESWAKRIPQGLNQEKMEGHFLEEICRLNADPSFWAGEENADFLHEYLRRYVIMFFDNPFRRDTFLEDHVKEFMDSHRKWQFPERKRRMTVTEASSIFGVAKDILESMNKRSIIRLFRRMAKKLHPDKGGKHEDFIKLADAYRELLKRKQHK